MLEEYRPPQVVIISARGPERKDLTAPDGPPQPLGELP